MQNEPSGDFYDYTQTMAPERPWLLPYHQSLVYKTMNAYKDEVGNLKEVHLTFAQTLELIERMHNMTLGMPQVVYLTGWQYNGHDSKYPAWEEVNAALKRDEDATALDSLRWLMREARRRFDCRVSLHVNMMDAYPDSPYWDEYVAKDIIAKDEDGKVIPGKPWGGMVSYQMSYTQEWKTGLAQRRIDRLIAMLPELAESGTIHIDAFLGERPKEGRGKLISPLLGYTKAEEAATQRKIYRYWRDRGIDVTSEWAFGLRDDRFVGLQPWCWHQEDKLADLPASLYCSTKLVGCDMWFIEDRMNPPNLREKFYLEVLPWYFRNNPEGGSIDGMVDGTDICMPARWCREKTLIAYSSNGFTARAWSLPADWKGVSSVTLDRITYKGCDPCGTLGVQDGKVAFSLTAGEAVRITPVVHPQ